VAETQIAPPHHDEALAGKGAAAAARSNSDSGVETARWSNLKPFFHHPNSNPNQTLTLTLTLTSAPVQSTHLQSDNFFPV